MTSQFNSPKLPKVPQKYCESVHWFYSVYKLAKAFNSSRYRAFEVMASLNEDQAKVVNDNGRKLPKVPPRYCESVHQFYNVYNSWQSLGSVYDGARTK